MVRRSGQLWSRDQTKTVIRQSDPVVSTTFIDAHHFELGSRRFDLYSVRGGETLDSLIVWLPKERALFTGNLTGPLFGHVPLPVFILMQPTALHMRRPRQHWCRCRKIWRFTCTLWEYGSAVFVRDRR
jgi:hypothetical protein